MERWYAHQDSTELTPEISVCRFATETAVEHMRSKVARLAAPGLVGKSRTMTRNLAKDGLMEDGKEQLLEGKSCCFILFYLHG
jgi:ribonuclease H2 subunit B